MMGVEGEQVVHFPNVILQRQLGLYILYYQENPDRYNLDRMAQ